jgi:hypothetical protein
VSFTQKISPVHFQNAVKINKLYENSFQSSSVGFIWKREGSSEVSYCVINCPSKTFLDACPLSDSYYKIFVGCLHTTSRWCLNLLKLIFFFLVASNYIVIISRVSKMGTGVNETPNSQALITLNKGQKYG